ncbi:hypothetical protein THAOC_28012 [Thalassiosira oceanica]|uniref:RING-type domain-containing protein n=1 Tax=Thalassiosira oceanica TaxID=159749 RepID=K0RG70_THAOC|nr:hypothetical protein THAOC_28012 [Thalassiosira oceanica]|eukprot:EJK52683.1 hypothetical protein THAOC_28012 [Thalassiosira oceanica]
MDEPAGHDPALFNAYSFGFSSLTASSQAFGEAVSLLSVRATLHPALASPEPEMPAAMPAAMISSTAVVLAGIRLITSSSQPRRRFAEPLEPAPVPYRRVQRVHYPVKETVQRSCIEKVLLSSKARTVQSGNSTAPLDDDDDDEDDAQSNSLRDGRLGGLPDGPADHLGEEGVLPRVPDAAASTWASTATAWHSTSAASESGAPTTTTVLIPAGRLPRLRLRFPGTARRAIEVPAVTKADTETPPASPSARPRGSPSRRQEAASVQDGRRQARVDHRKADEEPAPVRAGRRAVSEVDLLPSLRRSGRRSGDSRFFPLRHQKDPVFFSKDVMKICGACVRELPDDSFSAEQRARRQSIRRCEECVAAGNQLVLMKKGRTRSEKDDCPICQLPLPLDIRESLFRECCVKRVCKGCELAARKRGMRDCPFCRAPSPDKSQILAMVRKRVDAGDPVAIFFVGAKYHVGEYGLEKDVTRAVELYERAAELGVKEAHRNLGVTYANGIEVEKDMAKAFRHFEEAAMSGHVPARYNLGCWEYKAGNFDLALQHWMISAKLGEEDSLNKVKTFFMAGLATKNDYASALRGHQSAIEEMSSPDRDEVKNIEKKSRKPPPTLSTELWVVTGFVAEDNVAGLQFAGISLFLSKCPIGLESGPIERPRPGDHGLGLGRAREGPYGEHSSKNSTAASVTKCPSSAKRLSAFDRVVWAELDAVSGTRRRQALGLRGDHVALNERRVRKRRADRDDRVDGPAGDPPGAAVVFDFLAEVEEVGLRLRAPRVGGPRGHRDATDTETPLASPSARRPGSPSTPPSTARGVRVGAAVLREPAEEVPRARVEAVVGRRHAGVEDEARGIAEPAVQAFRTADDRLEWPSGRRTRSPLSSALAVRGRSPCLMVATRPSASQEAALLCFGFGRAVALRPNTHNFPEDSTSPQAPTTIVSP